MTANTFQILQQNPRSFEYEPSVIEIMNQIDQMFKLLEKSSQEVLLRNPDIYNGSTYSQRQRRGFIKIGLNTSLRRSVRISDSE